MAAEESSLEKLLRELDRKEAERLAAENERNRAKTERQQLLNRWNHAYDEFQQGDDESCVIETVNRLKQLRQEILDRFWDFRIGYTLNIPGGIKDGYQVPLELLKSAILDNEFRLRQLLLKARRHLLPRLIHHQELLTDFLASEDENGPVALPPMTKRELSALLGRNYDALSKEIDRAKETPKKGWHGLDRTSINGHAMQRRGWLHADPAEQRRALLTFRQKFPKRIWAPIWPGYRQTWTGILREMDK